MKELDVIVVGGGITGSSILHHLHLAGIHKTLLIEKESKLGRGATGSWGSLVRMFHDCPQRMERACESVPFYIDIASQPQNKSHFLMTGALYFLNESIFKNYGAHIKLLENSGLDFKIVRAKEGKKRFPDFEWYEDDVAIYEPNAGSACPYWMTEELTREPCRSGAEKILNGRVTKIITNNNHVEGVELEDGNAYYAKNVVLAAGMWSLNLLESIGSTVDIRPEVIQLNRFRKVGFSRNIPIFVDLEASTFGQSAVGGSFIGGYEDQTHKKPKNKKAMQHLSLTDANIAKHKLAKRLPWIRTATIEGGLRALDSYTKDNLGIAKVDSKYSNLIVAAGMSCGGFTAAPYYGKKITELVLGSKKATEESLPLAIKSPIPTSPTLAQANS